MVHITTLEKGLKRLLGLCPNLTLDTESIQLIIDGKQNEVISKHKGTWKEPKIHITTDDEEIDKIVEDAINKTINN